MINTGEFKNLGMNNNNNDDIQSKLLTAIARSAEDLTNGKGWPDGLNELLENIGKITKVSRVWIFQTLKLTKKSIIQDYVFEWSSKKEYVQIKLPAFSRFETKINEPDYKLMIQSRLERKYQNIIVSKLKPSANKRNLEAQNVKSMLTIPIFVENHWWGVLGLDDCEREYEWSDSMVALLRTAAYLISSAILRDKLSAKKRQLDILQQITEYTVWEFDLNRKYLWFTSNIFDKTFKNKENFQLTFKNILKIIHKDDRVKLIEKINSYIKNKSEKFRCDVRINIKKDNYIWMELIGTITNKAKNRNSKLIGVAIDISKRKKNENRLREEASTDSLTGILNRRKLEQIMEEQFILDKQNKNIFSFLMIDIDFFKKINDTYGHPVGDKILIHIVNICKSYLRKSDYFARMGGEEFAILLPSTNKYESSLIANRIKDKVGGTPYQYQDNPIYCTISIGCVSNNDQIPDISQIYKLADSALYLAKKSGRNLVCSI